MLFGQHGKSEQTSIGWDCYKHPGLVLLLRPDSCQDEGVVLDQGVYKINPFSRVM